MMPSHFQNDNVHNAKVKVHTQNVVFSPPFQTTPSVVLAQRDIWQWADGAEDYYGWYFNAESVTTSGFTAKVHLWDRWIDQFYGIWIACSS